MQSETKKWLYVLWIIVAGIGSIALGGYFTADGLSSRPLRIPPLGGMYFLAGIGGIVVGFTLLIWYIPYYFRTELKPPYDAENQTTKEYETSTNSPVSKAQKLRSYWIKTDFYGHIKQKTTPDISFLPWGGAPGGVPIGTVVVLDNPKEKEAFDSLTEALEKLGGKIEQVGIEIPQNKRGEPKGFSVSSNGGTVPLYNDVPPRFSETLNKTGRVQILLSLDPLKANSARDLPHVIDLQDLESNH